MGTVNWTSLGQSYLLARIVTIYQRKRYGWMYLENYTYVLVKSRPKLERLSVTR